MAGRHLRKHWKKYGLGISTWLASSWAAKKHREGIILQRYCLEAKKYGEENIPLTERPKKVYVFLNPSANDRDAKRLFQKYSAPLLHLWGADVIIIESDYEGQIETIMKYIQPSTATLIVAGGGGTLLEVVNGLLKRTKTENLNIPIGVVPLGKENVFFKRYLETLHEKSLPARTIAEATMNIIRGNMLPVDVMKLQPSKGNTMYALSSIDCGAVYDAETNKDSFWIFGRLRTFFSYLNVAIRRWPSDFMLNIKQELPEVSSNSSVVSGDNCIGFNVTLNENSTLSCSKFSLAKITKLNFITEGFMRTCYKSRKVQLPQDIQQSSQFSIFPISSTQQWFIVDGEPFEALPLNISIEHKLLHIIHSPYSI